MLKALIITLNRRGPSMEYYAALGGVLLLLGIALITPGPNALTCFAHGGMFGPRSNIPLIGGMVIGFVTIEMSVGLLVNSLNDSPTALTVLHWIGMVFLALMVLGMFRVNPSSINTEGVESMLGVKVGICMQFVNGKEWAFVIILMSNYIEPLGRWFARHSDDPRHHTERLRQRHDWMDDAWRTLVKLLFPRNERKARLPNLWSLACAPMGWLASAGAIST
jgi:hypothetical protein